MSLIGEQVSREQAEELAIYQAQKAEGFTGSNPPVGCVIVDKNHCLVSLGHTQKEGEAHAEIHAINHLEDKDLLKGATIYTTLEPCSHQGRTGSCAQVLLNTPVESVIIGKKDPNPLVNGKGIEILKQSQKKIEVFKNQSYELSRLIEAFKINVLQKRCFVAAKVGASMDGAIALESGESQWITGEESRKYVHELRGRYDAILVGQNTIAKDNPNLNIRSKKYANKKNQLIVIDLKEKVLSQMKNYQCFSHYQKDTLLGVSGVAVSKLEASEAARGQKEFKKFFVKDKLDLNLFLKTLYSDFNICSLFVEGGAYTLSQFLKQKLCDRFYHFIAPSVLGSQSRLFSHDLKFKELSLKLEFEFDFVQKIGSDLLIESHLKL